MGGKEAARISPRPPATGVGRRLWSVRMTIPRARLFNEAGGEREWRSQTIPAYKRVTKRAETIIAGAYLAGTNTRRVRRALQGLFGARIGTETAAPSGLRHVIPDETGGATQRPAFSREKPIPLQSSLMDPPGTG
jgi:hypothetical protein